MNPLKTWRENRSMSRTELALLAGVAYSQVMAAESGHAVRLPGRITRAVAYLDGKQAAQDLASAFALWRDEQAAQLVASLRATN